MVEPTDQSKRGPITRYTKEQIDAVAAAVNNPLLFHWKDVEAAVGLSAKHAASIALWRKFPKIARYGNGHNFNNYEWSKEQTDKLISLVKDGIRPSAEIARQMGITKNMVMGKLWRLGIYLKPVQPLSAFDHPLMHLPTNGCRWPNIDRTTATTQFCGAKIAGPRLPYCPRHMTQANIKGSSLNDIKLSNTSLSQETGR